MIEIFVIIWFSAHLGSAAESKRRTRNWGWLGVGAWFGGEILGAIVGTILFDNLALVYLVAIGTGLALAVIADRYVHSLPVAPTAPGAMAMPAAPPVATASESQHEPCPGCSRRILAGLARCPYCKAELGP